MPQTTKNTDRLYSGNFTQLEEAAAKTNPDPVAFKQDVTLSHFLSAQDEFKGKTPSEIYSTLDQSRELYFEVGSNKEAYNASLLLRGHKDMHNEKHEASGEDSRVEMIAAGENATRINFGKDFPTKPFSYFEEFFKSAERGTAQLALGSISGTLDVLGFRDAASFVAKENRLFQQNERVAVDPRIAAFAARNLNKAFEPGGLPIGVLATPEFWVKDFAETVLPNAVFFSGAYLGVGRAANLLFKTKALSRLSPVIQKIGRGTLTAGTIAVGESSVNSGLVIGEVQAEQENLLKTSLEIVGRMSDEQKKTILGRAFIEATEEMQSVEGMTRSKRAASNAASEVFARNVVLNGITELVTFGAASTFVKLLKKPIEGSQILTLAAGGTSAGITLAAQAQQELTQDDIDRVAVFKALTGKMMDLDMLDNTIPKALAGDDPQKKMTVLISLFMGARATVFQVSADMFSAGSVSKFNLNVDNFVKDIADKVKENEGEGKQEVPAHIRKFASDLQAAETLEEKVAIVKENNKDIIPGIQEELEAEIAEAEKDAAAIAEADRITAELNAEQAEIDRVSEPQVTTKTTVANIQKAIDESTTDFTGINITPVQAIEDIPDTGDANSQIEKGKNEGVFIDRNGGEIWLVADNIEESRLKLVIPHEVLHLGLRLAAGKKSKLKLVKDVNRLVDQLYAGFTPGEIASLSDRYDVDLSTQKSRRTEAEEFLARIAEDENADPNILQKIYSAIRQFLRDLGFTIHFSDSDINAIISEARQAVNDKQPTLPQDATGQDIRFSKAPPVGSKEFDAKFGKTKAVGKDGKPLKVFHGSNVEFSDFSKELLGSSTKSKSAFKGFFFVDNKAVAAGFGDLANDRAIQNLIDASEKAERRKDFDESHRLMVEAENLEQTQERPVFVKSGYLEINDPLIIDAEGKGFLELDVGLSESLDNAKKAGNDGLIIKNFRDNAGFGQNTISDHFVVFKNDQFGEVTEAASPDIRFSKAPPVKSEAFKKWFGDSKVVDFDGNPLPVYKGINDFGQPEPGVISVIDRPSEFPAFNKGEPGVKIAGFFTDDLFVAQRFAEALTLPFSERITVYLSFQNPFIIDAKNTNSGIHQFGESGKPFRDAIRSGKYDGVIINNTSDEGNVYVALHPNQIKEVTNENPTSSPDIRFSKAPSRILQQIKEFRKEKLVEITKDSKEFKKLERLKKIHNVVGRNVVNDGSGDIVETIKERGGKILSEDTLRKDGGYFGTFAGGPVEEVVYLVSGKKRYAYIINQRPDVDDFVQESIITESQLGWQEVDELISAQSKYDNIALSGENVQKLNKATREEFGDDYLSLFSRPDIRFSKAPPEGIQRVFDSAIKRFGTTDNIKDAGFVLPDGRMLDFKRNAKEDTDFISHINVAQAGTELRHFISMGGIRMDFNQGFIHVGKLPTAAQFEVINEIASVRPNPTTVDLSDARNLQHLTIENPKKVVGTIRRFFRGEDVSDIRFSKTPDQKRRTKEISAELQKVARIRKNPRKFAEERDKLLSKRQAELAEAIEKITIERGFSPEQVAITGNNIVEKIKAVTIKPKEKREGIAVPSVPSTDPVTPDLISKDTVNPEAPIEQEQSAPVPVEEIEKITADAKTSVLGLMSQDPEVSAKSIDVNSPIFLQAYKKTIMNVLGKANDELVYGRSRTTITNKIRKIEEAKTQKGVDNRVSDIVQQINRTRNYSDAKAMMKKVDRLLGAKRVWERESRTKPLVKKEMHPEQKRWLKLVKNVYRKGLEGVEDAIGEVETFLNTTALSGDEKAIAKFKTAMETFAPSLKENFYGSLTLTEVAKFYLKALSQYGALQKREVTQIGEALENLQNDLNGGIKRIEELIKAQAEIEGTQRVALIDGITPAKGKKFKEPGIVDQMAIATLSLDQRLNDIIRHGTPAKKAEAKRIIDKIAEDLQRADTQELTEIRLALEELDTILEKIYGEKEPGRLTRIHRKVTGKKSEQIRKELEAPQEKYRKYSKNESPRALSKANLIQIYVTGIQTHYEGNFKEHERDGEYFEDLTAELTKQDFQLIEWLQKWHEAARPSISAKSEENIGVPVVSPAYNYMPVAIRRILSALNELHTTTSIIPKRFTLRVKNLKDIQEETSVLNLWAQTVQENAKYKASGQLNLELTNLFGNEQLQEKINSIHGEHNLKQLIDHVTDVVTGGFAEADKIKLVDELRSIVTLTSLAFNAGVSVKQITSIPAFGFEIGLSNVGRHVLSFSTAEGIAAARIIWNSEQRKNRFNSGNDEGVTNAINQPSDHAVVKWLQAAMVTVSLGDIGPTLIVGQGIYRDFYEQNIRSKGMSKEDAKSNALDKTFMIVERTQQSSKTKDIALWQRRLGSFGRLAGQFKSTQRQFLSYEITAIRDIMADVNPETRDRLKNVLIINHLLLPAFFAGVGLGFRKTLGKDIDDDEWKDWLFAMAIGPLSGLVLLGSVGEAILEAAFLGEKNFFDALFPVEKAKDVGGTFGLLIHHVVSMDLGAALKDVDKLAQSAAPPWRHLRQFYENRIKN